MYLVTNRVNGKQYVGQTTGTPEARWRSHVKDTARRRRYALQSAIAKYGPEAFDVVAIEHCSSLDDLNAAEAYWIHWYGTVDFGYNLTYGGDAAPKSAITCARISAAKKGKPPSQAMLDAARKTAKARVGCKLSPEWRANIGSGQVGNRRGPETGEKIGAKKRGIPLTEEHRRKVGEAGRGKRRSPETIERMRVAARKRWESAEYRKIQSDNRVGALNPMWRGGVAKRRNGQSEDSDVVSVGSSLLPLVHK